MTTFIIVNAALGLILVSLLVTLLVHAIHADRSALRKVSETRGVRHELEPRYAVSDTALSRTG
jgi:hypothetical protein